MKLPFNRKHFNFLISIFSFIKGSGLPFSKAIQAAIPVAVRNRKQLFADPYIKGQQLNKKFIFCEEKP